MTNFSDFSPEEQQLREKNQHRIRDFRAKILALIFLAAIAIFVSRVLLPTIDEFSAVQARADRVNSQIQNFQSEIDQFQQERSLYDSIPQIEPQILSCLNENRGCTTLPAEIRSRLGIITSFLRIQNLDAQKFRSDESKILAFFNEFVFAASSAQIIEISRSNPQEISSILQEIPLTLRVRTSSPSQLLQILQNLEKNLAPQRALRQFVRVDRVQTDPTASTPQESTIEITIFYTDFSDAAPDPSR